MTTSFVPGSSEDTWVTGALHRQHGPQASQRPPATSSSALSSARDLAASPPLATGPSALSSATGPASSSVARATGLAAPPATGPSALSSAVNSSCKDLAWEASCPSGVTGRGKKNLGKKKAAPDDDRRQTTEDARRRRVVFGNVAFDIIQV